VLLSENFDGQDPWIDPAELITKERIASVAAKLNVPIPEVRSIYEALARDFNLQIG
jgi:hypothetical protein